MTNLGTFSPFLGALVAPVPVTSSPDIAGDLAPAGMVLGLVTVSAAGILLAAGWRRPAPIPGTWPRTWSGHGALAIWRMLTGALVTLLPVAPGPPAPPPPSPPHPLPSS